MAEHTQLYQRAYYYDIALERDVSSEADFIYAVHQELAGGPPGSLLEIACGPGYHARLFAKREIRVIGLDLMPDMLQLADEKARAEGVQITWLAADMRRFDLPEPVDMAFSLFDALDCLTSDEDIVRHFQTVAENLKPGGLYLVDVTHPREIGFERYGDCRYSGERDGVRVDIHWGVNRPHFDFVTGLSNTEVEVTVDDHGYRSVIRDRATERLLLPAELRLLAKMSGVMEPVAWYGDYRTDQPLDYSPASRRLIVVFRKR